MEKSRSHHHIRKMKLIKSAVFCATSISVALVVFAESKPVSFGAGTGFNNAVSQVSLDFQQHEMQASACVADFLICFT